MFVDLIGYRFSPTSEELVNHYLKNKNLGKIWLVHNAIGEINICNFEPKDLPFLAKINSDDLVWYFFSPIVYANARKTTMKRTTRFGFWKPTGRDRIIKDKRGHKGEIGIKKTLVYHQGKGTNGVRTPWVMHEYHITCLPPDLTTYVLCQVKYKGDQGETSYGGGSGSLVSHSNTDREINIVPEVEVDQTVDDGFSLSELNIPLPLDAVNPNLQQQTPEVQIEQPREIGMSLDELERQLNEQEDPRRMDAIYPNTYFNDDNPNLLQQIPEVQIEQPHEGSMFLDEIETQLNEQVDLRPMDAIDPNMVFNYDNPNLLQQTLYNDAELDYLLTYNGGNYNVICDRVTIQENYNVYMPRKALSGIIVDCGSDSDDCAESIYATTYQGSPHGSVGSSNKDFPCCCSCTDPYNNPQTSEYLRMSQWHNVPSKQEGKRATSRDNKTSMVNTEKNGWFSLEKAMETNHKPWYIYLMNMITGIIILMGFIANIGL